MDTLSDVLSLLKPRSYMAGGFDVGGELSIQFPQHEGIKCYALVSGHCWLSVEGVAEPVLINAGDCFLLTRGWPFHLASNHDLTPVDFRMVLKSGRVNGSINTVNAGGTYFMVGGHFALEGHYTNMLQNVLPPIVHIQKESDKTTLRWSIERMMQELREPQPGGVLVIQHLAQMILIQALRSYLAEGLNGSVGWLFALSDKQIGAAVNAMHDNPAHGWTLQELAGYASMSRSSFAFKFKKTVGKSPMDYLTNWRMMLASDKLKNSSDSISVIAEALGYESESAFGTAFKRIMGCAPRQYSRGVASLLSSYEQEKVAHSFAQIS